MEEKKVIDFNSGDEIQGFYLIKNFNLKTSNNNKKYLDFTFADKTGEINGKLWDVKPDNENLFTVGMVVKIRGTVTLWQNQHQLKIVKMRPQEESDVININDLVPSAPLDENFMYDEIMSYINAMADEDIKMITKEIVEAYKARLLYAPAAKSNHHAIRSGLLYHILRMLQSAEKLTQVYETLNRDLLYAGVILHDMEKINEMVSDELGIVSSYSIEGQMLGHIIMGVRKIDEVAKNLGVDSEKSMLLQHLILTHHYEPEFGSPKKPMIPEGEILHYLDIIDARIYDMDKMYKGMEPGEVSDPIWSMDKRRIYKKR